MAVVAGSRVVGTKSYRSCPATCRSVVVAVCGAVGVSVGDVVSNYAYLIDNLDHGLSIFILACSTSLTLSSLRSLRMSTSKNT